MRVANYPRLKRDVTFTRDDWAARRPGTTTVWLSASDALPHEFALIHCGEDANARGPRRYDLSPVAMLLLSVSLVLEGAALVLCWRRRSVPNA